MATKLTVDFDDKDILQIEASLLQPGDFFERNGLPYMFVKRAESIMGDYGQVVRIGGDIGVFKIYPTDTVHVYKKIELLLERI